MLRSGLRAVVLNLWITQPLDRSHLRPLENTELQLWRSRNSSGGKSPHVNVDALKSLFTVTFPLWKNGINLQLQIVFWPSLQSRASTVPFQNCSLVLLKLQYWEASSFSMEKTVCSNHAIRNWVMALAYQRTKTQRVIIFFKAVADSCEILELFCATQWRESPSGSKGREGKQGLETMHSGNSS